MSKILTQWQMLASSVRCPRAQTLSRRSQGAPLVSPNCHPHSPPQNSLEAVAMIQMTSHWQPKNDEMCPCDIRQTAVESMYLKLPQPGHQPPPQHGPTKKSCGSGPPGLKVPPVHEGSELIPVHSQAFHQYASPKKNQVNGCCCVISKWALNGCDIYKN